jgi:hypothetical protein
MLQKADELGSKSIKAMAMWIGHAVALEFKYAAILRNSTHPGFLSRAKIEQYKDDLRKAYGRQSSTEADK